MINHKAKLYSKELRSDSDAPYSLDNRTINFGRNSAGVLQTINIPLDVLSNRYISLLAQCINSGKIYVPSSRVNIYRRAIEHLIHVCVSNSGMDYRYLGDALLKRLKEAGIAERPTKNFMDVNRRVISCAMDAVDDVRLKVEIREIRERWPNLRSIPSHPVASLEGVFAGELEYSNEQYLVAITEYAAAFISAWSGIRAELRKNHPQLLRRIAGAVSRIGKSGLKDIEARRTYPGCKDFANGDWLEVLSINIEALVTLNHPLLNSIALSQHRGIKHLSKLLSSANVERLGADGYASLFLGSRLIDRQSQKMTVAARATAERKVCGHLS